MAVLLWAHIHPSIGGAVNIKVASRMEAVGVRRSVITFEIVARIVLLLVVPTVLPLVFFGDPLHYWRIAQKIDPTRAPYLQWVPYRKVFWEYPPLTLPVLGLAKLAQGSFALYRTLVGGTMIACELGCLNLLRRAWPAHWRSLTVVWNLTVLPIAVLTWFRLDFMVTLFATMALLSIAQRTRGGAASIVAGFATKLWPVLMVAPLSMRRRWKDLALSVGGSAAALIAWYMWSPSGLTKFLNYRSTNGLELESLLGGFALLGHHAAIHTQSGTWVLIDAGGSWAQPTLYLALAVITALSFWRARGPGTDMVAFSGALIVAAMLCSWILSPQYIVWAAPFVAVLAARGHRRIAVWYGGATVVTFLYLLEFQKWYATPGAHTTDPIAALAIIVRNALLIAVLVEMIVAIRPAPESATGREMAAAWPGHAPAAASSDLALP